MLSTFNYGNRDESPFNVLQYKLQVVLLYSSRKNVETECKSAALSTGENQCLHCYLIALKPVKFSYWESIDKLHKFDNRNNIVTKQ